MPPVTMLDAVEFSKIPSLGFVVPVVAADPTGYEAGFIYNSTTKEVKYHNGTSWVALGTAGAGGPPSGAAGGDLSGSYPSPQIAAGVIVDADVNASANIAQSKINGLPASLAGKVDNTVQVVAGAGLTGGGALTASQTVNVGAGTGITVNADDVAINRTTVDAWYVDVGGDTMTGLLTLSADPSSPMHAATKQYVDLTAQGLDFKNSVKAASTANLTLTGTQTVDGVALVANDRVLVKDQTTSANNGIYLVQAGAWSRTTDADASGEISDGTVVPVEGGTVNGDSLFLCSATSSTPWTPNSSGSTWTRFSSVNDLVAGTGLTKTGTTIDFVAGDSTLTVAADNVVVASAPKWTTPRSITLTGDVTGTAAAVDGSANISIATTVAVAGTAPKHFAGNVPAGTSCAITHNLNTRDVTVEVYRNSGNYDTVLCDVWRTDANTVTLKFATAVAASAFRCVVVGR